MCVEVFGVLLLAASIDPSEQLCVDARADDGAGAAVEIIEYEPISPLGSVWAHCHFQEGELQLIVRGKDIEVVSADPRYCYDRTFIRSAREMNFGENATEEVHVEFRVWRESHNKGFNRPPERSGPAKPGGPSGGAG